MSAGVRGGARTRALSSPAPAARMRGALPRRRGCEAAAAAAADTKPRRKGKGKGQRGAGRRRGDPDLDVISEAEGEARAPGPGPSAAAAAEVNNRQQYWEHSHLMVAWDDAFTFVSTDDRASVEAITAAARRGHELVGRGVVLATVTAELASLANTNCQ